jgi:hypothetical protein
MPFRYPKLNAISRLADYNKLIFPKGLSQREIQFGGQLQMSKAEA